MNSKGKQKPSRTTVLYGMGGSHGTISREVSQSEGCGRLPLQLQAALNSK